MTSRSEWHAGAAPAAAGNDRAIVERMGELSSAGPLAPGTVALCVAAVAM